MDKQKQYEIAKPFLIFKHTEKQHWTSFWDWGGDGGGGVLGFFLLI